ncbi:MAG: DNA modification methylase [Planctomycetales bacterium]|nr:DNA modification methylase [Planctomycetales bacterium]
MNMPRDRIQKLVRIPAGQLRPNPRNWRTHPDTQRRALRTMLDEVGYADALLARETAGGLELVDGHLRADLDPEAIVPVLVLDLNEAEANLVLATLDPLAAMAEADCDKLSVLLDDLHLANDELSAHLSKLLGEPPAFDFDCPLPPVDNFAADQSALRKKWRVAKGQLWQIGVHRLLCGDATQTDDYDRLLGAAMPVAMITDPPYGVSYDPLWRERKGKLVGSQRATIPNDDAFDWSAAFRLFTGNVAYVWHASRFSGQVQRQIEACGFRLRAQIIWAKQHFALSRGDYHWQHEPCWYAVRAGERSHWQGDRSQSTLWQIANLSAFGATDSDQATFHGTQKPAECMARPMRNNTAPGDAVYDPFLGSGTTMVAAEHLGRVCYGMEIDPVFCALTLERMENFGCHPVLIDESMEESEATHASA